MAHEEGNRQVVDVGTMADVVEVSLIARKSHQKWILIVSPY